MIVDELIGSSVSNSESGSANGAPVLTSNVLNKVANLTWEKPNMEQKTSKPKFVRGKPDFQSYEKFKGIIFIRTLFRLLLLLFNIVVIKI